MKKVLALIMTMTILLMSVTVNAAFTDIPKNASYANSVTRLAALGIIDSSAKDVKFLPDRIVTREEFAKMIVLASNNSELAEVLKDDAKFPDVDLKNGMSKFINAAVDKGYISAMADGKFHPKDSVNFATVCTSLVKALGYGDNDLSGLWPKNYMDKAKAIGLTNGISLKSSDGVPRWIMAVMLDRMLTTKTKKASPAESDKIFAEAVGLYSECIVLENSQTSNKLAENQVSTDKGILYTENSAIKLEPGKKYRVKLSNDLIEKVYEQIKTVVAIKLESSKDTSITYKKDGDNALKDMVLPQKTIYYYNGVKQTYDNLKNILKRGQTIYFAYTDDKSGYEYAVIVNPYEYNLGSYVESIITGSSKTSESLDSNQIQTDTGIYTLPNTGTKLELGAKYGLIVSNDRILKVTGKINSTVNIAASSTVETTVKYRDGSTLKSMVLPQKPVYYYKGAKVNYESVKGIVQTGSSIVFAVSEDGKGYDYAVIFDPIYSKPEIGSKYDPSSKKLGSISLSDNPKIAKDGAFITQEQIESLDVVYKVSDLWNTESYIMAVGKHVEGKLTGILPNKISPKTIQIDGKNYEIGKDMDITKIQNSISSFNTDDNVIVVLGYDGKAVDLIYPDSSLTSNYAFVINTSSATSTSVKDYGKVTYTAKLLLANGRIETYKTITDPSSLKGNLATYSKIDNETVELTKVETSALQESVIINKDEKKIGAYYITGDVKIFNYVAFQTTADCEASVIDWAQLPSGKIDAGKVLHLSKVGEFNDVNLVVLNDIYDHNFRVAYVKKVESVKSGRTSSFLHTMLVGGKEYTYSTPQSAYGVDTAVTISFSNNNVNYVLYSDSPEVTATRIQAIDSKRIKINNSVYLFKNNIAIYYKDISGNVSPIGINDIDVSTQFTNVSVYLDKSLESNGKVEMIVINQ
ncbi:MAG: S-layer homology domain-containing protein [Clostridia bacterium]|nr:S-layer homology domain-containing protein [Clostridia bacterium]